MTTATFIDIAQSTTIATATPIKPIENDEAASYLFFTPIPGTSMLGIHNNEIQSNLYATYANAPTAQNNKKVTTPPTVLLAAHPDASFDMEELGVAVSELGTHDELCIMNLFDRKGHAFALAPRVRKGDDWDCN